MHNAIIFVNKFHAIIIIKTAFITIRRLTCVCMLTDILTFLATTVLACSNTLHAMFTT